MANISAIVLAAGLSRRMGDSNKLFLDFRGNAIVKHVIDQVAQCTVYEVIVVTSKIHIDKFRDLEIGNTRIVINRDSEKGMTSSIQTGIVQLNDESEGFMVCLGDQPLIKTGTYNQIIKSFSESLSENEKAISLPYFKEKRGNPVVFSSYYKDQILKHAEPEGCKSIVRKNKQYVHEVNVNDSGILIDIDTSKDYTDLLKI